MFYTCKTILVRNREGKLEMRKKKKWAIKGIQGKKKKKLFREGIESHINKWSVGLGDWPRPGTINEAVPNNLAANLLNPQSTAVS